MNTKDLFYFSKGLGFKISKEFSEKIEENTSFSAYKIEGDIEIRISNHKTKLRTWLNNNKSNGIPQVCISIVCKCDDELDKISNDTNLPDNVDFSVQQFIYDFRTFTKEDIKVLADNINATFQNMSYPNNALPNGQHPSPEYVTKTDSKLIDKLAKKVKKRIIPKNDLLFYNHPSLKGNLEEKIKILNCMARDLEPKRHQIKSLNQKLETDIFSIFNNCNIRHNNDTPEYEKKYNQNFASLDDCKKEKIYDYLYRCCLIAYIELQNADVQELVNDVSFSGKTPQKLP